MRRRHEKFGIPLLAILVGCTSPQAQQSLDRENSHLRWLVRLYMHASQQGGAPKSEGEFKQFINGIDTAMRDRTLAGAEVRSVDELFISERDGLPYVIFYDPTPSVASGVIAFEQRGTGGRRYVAYTVGMVEEVDEQRFDTLVPRSARSPQ